MRRLFIHGGWAGDTRFGLNYAGLPSRAFWGPFFFRFPIGDRHTVYEWATALADRHPYPPHLGDMKAATVAGMRRRESAINIYSDQANAIYHELKIEFDADRLRPLRREWCMDRPDVLDFTRCLLSLDQVLSIVRRRGDGGWLIGKLLTAAEHGASQTPSETAEERLRQASQPKIHKAIQAVYDKAEAAKEKPPNVNEVIAPVQARLSAAGYEASGRLIRDLAGERRHAVRRWPRGKRIPK
jgi:hypothetical protein